MKTLTASVCAAIAAMTLVGVSTPVFAAKEEAKCKFTITRTPCSEKTREEALKLYGGKETADMDGKAKDQAACIAEAGDKKISGIVRTKVLLKKVTVTKFEGKVVGSTITSDSTECEK